MEEQPLLRFLRAARGAGVRISPAESMDAVRAVDLVGYRDRAALKDTLSLVLAKTVDEKVALSRCFDLFFSRAPLAAAPEFGEEAKVDAEDIELGELAAALLAGDQASLAAAIEGAAEATGLSNIRLFTQANRYAWRILESMGSERLERDIAALAAAAPMTAQRLAKARNRLRDRVRDQVEQSLVLYSREESDRLREETSRNVRLTAVDRRELARMRVIVRAMARRLRDRYARPRKHPRRGQLDVRRTIRRNAGWGGVPFRTAWKQRRLEKPQLMVLCDVSGSVAAMAEFLLLLLYTLKEALADLRAFVFSSELVEASEILKDKEINEAIAEIMRKVGLGSSNYGRCLGMFEDGWMDAVTPRTTVLILGDGRGNYTDPRTEVLRRLRERAKRVIWLNPEYRSYWGTGDSDMLRYAPLCTLATECNTLSQLERIVADLLD